MEQNDRVCELPLQMYPKCGFCGEQPARVIMSNFPLGPIVAMVFFCGNPECQKVFTVVPIGPAPRPEPLIIDPRSVN